MIKYDETITRMSLILKERHVCLSSRNAHEKCYSELRDYLSSINKKYSLEEA